MMGLPVTGRVFSSVFTRYNLSDLRHGSECKVPSERFGKWQKKETGLRSGSEKPAKAQWLLLGLTGASRA